MAVKAVLPPLGRVGVNVFPDAGVVRVVADHMIVAGTLPDVFAANSAAPA